MAQPDYRHTTTNIDVQFHPHGIRAWLSCVLDDGKMLLLATDCVTPDCHEIDQRDTAIRGMVAPAVARNIAITRACFEAGRLSRCLSLVILAFPRRPIWRAALPESVASEARLRREPVGLGAASSPARPEP